MLYPIEMNMIYAHLYEKSMRHTLFTIQIKYDITLGLSGKIMTYISSHSTKNVTFIVSLPNESVDMYTVPYKQ